MVSSTDGYCSVITFSKGELGEPYKKKDQSTQEKSQGSTSNSTPVKEEPANTEDAKPVANFEPTEDQQMPLGDKPSLGDDNSVRQTVTSSSEPSVESSAASSAEVSEKKPSVESDVEVISGKQPAVESGVKEAPNNESKTEPSEESCDVQVMKVNDSEVAELPSDIKSKLTVSDKILTPVASEKKARRVQLITLSSPKSKKKLL